MILIDWFLGGFSMKDGFMEIMFYWWFFKDDKRGVVELLNEMGISGKGLIVCGKLCLILVLFKEFVVLYCEYGEKFLLGFVFGFVFNSFMFKKWMS